MKKLIFPLYFKISAIVSAVLFACYLVTALLKSSGIYLYFAVFGSDEIIYVIRFLLAFFAVSGVTAFVYKNFRLKALTVIVSFLLQNILFFLCILSNIFVFDYQYYKYTSDDAKHEIVIKEESSVLIGWGYIYEKTSPVTMKLLYEYSTDNINFRPSHPDTYYFVWNEHDFELHYGHSDEQSEYTIELDFCK